MQLQQIRSFVAVAKAGSFTAAALELSMSQPALGLQIKQLESRLRAQLLQRHSRGVTLTKAGEIYFNHALNILSAVAEAERAVGKSPQKGPITIRFGIAPAPGRALLPCLFDVLQLRSEIELEVRHGLSDEFITLMQREALDASICVDVPDLSDLERIPLYSEDLFLVGGVGVLELNSVDIGSCNEIPLAALTNIPLVLDGRRRSTGRRIEAALTRLQLDFDLIEVEPPELKRELLLRHGRCTIVPYGLFHEDIINGKLFARRIMSPRLRRKTSLVITRKSRQIVSKLLLPAIIELVDRIIQERKVGWRKPSEAEA